MSVAQGNTTPLLEIRDLCKTYDNGTQALRNVNISVQAGEFLAVIGLSGSGKSTLLRCINSLIPATSGSILVEGKDCTHLKGKELREHRRSVGMIFQHFNLVKRRSVLENVLSGSLASVGTLASMIGHFSPELRDAALQNLDVVGIRDKADQRADSLSGGQQQRVAIARTLMQHPRLLLADEPVASLDPATSHSVMKYLELINKTMGTTVICNLHFLSLVRQYATRVIALRQGCLVFEGRPEQITEEWFREIYGDEATEVEIR